MTTQHPITPPPELVRQLLDDDDFPFQTGTCELLSITKDRLNHVITQAARWGADMELEAVLMWLRAHHFRFTNDVYAARRTKPPSLKEQALEALKHAQEGWRPVPADCAIIRRALESLPNEP